ncbi:MAG: DUF523 domain-containing protein [Bacteroides sp.]|nr:DUF523 domain-containing protein [Bacillota bacterium]MCM1394273.1 DUF523 domain-containing protein [[Eubacterium] siraeum]MCM1455954.1 DUF523 domain-containing protein [Bacteroides sp.]
MKKILVSACLMGYDCRYKGDGCKNDKVIKLSDEYILIPVCPEQLGGLSTPRHPAERVGDRVIAKDGSDVTEQYSRGADFAVEIAKANDVDYCILKANSPSCGKGVIYDGTFSGAKIQGNGVTAEKLLANGFTVITENDL